MVIQVGALKGGWSSKEVAAQTRLVSFGVPPQAPRHKPDLVIHSRVQFYFHFFTPLFHPEIDTFQTALIYHVIEDKPSSFGDQRLSISFTPWTKESCCLLHISKIRSQDELFIFQCIPFWPPTFSSHTIWYFLKRFLGSCRLKLLYVENPARNFKMWSEAR